MQTNEALEPVAPAPAGTVADTPLAGTVRTGDPERGAVTKNSIEASQGIKLGRMRWVLGASMVLAIGAMVVAYLLS